MVKKQAARDKTITTRQHKQERRKEEVQESEERVLVVTLVSVLWQVCLLTIQLTPEQRNIIKYTPGMQECSVADPDHSKNKQKQ
jgi:hypothetical protein